MSGGEGAGALVGQLLSDTYRIEQVLGEGGMGAVYAATHVRIGRPVAVKVLFPHVAANEEALKRFEREAKITSAIGHPNIVEILDFNTTAEGIAYLVMERLEGQDLAALIASAGPLPVAQVVDVTLQVAAALAAAHDSGVIHRDLKPSNIFVCPGAKERIVVKVVDFGISKVVGGSTAMTQTQMTMGTPAYMAPEQAEGRAKEADARTDIFALGAILYEMLSGTPPFASESIPSMLYKVVHGAHTPLHERRGGLGPAFDALVDRALAKAPAARFRSMRELSEALQAAVAAPAQAAVATPPQATAAPMQVAAGGVTQVAGGATQVAGGAPPAVSTEVTAATAQLVNRVANDPGTTLSSSAAELRAPPSEREGGGRRRGLALAAGGLVALLAVGGGLWFAFRQRSPQPPASPAAQPAATDLERPRPVAERPHPTAIQSPAGAAPVDARTAKAFALRVDSPRARVECRLALAGRNLELASSPCRFSVPAGAMATLTVARPGYGAVKRHWRASAALRLQVRVDGRRHILTLTGGAQFVPPQSTQAVVPAAKARVSAGSRRRHGGPSPKLSAKAAGRAAKALGASAGGGTPATRPGAPALLTPGAKPPAKGAPSSAKPPAKGAPSSAKPRPKTKPQADDWDVW